VAPPSPQSLTTQTGPHSFAQRRVGNKQPQSLCQSRTTQHPSSRHVTGVSLSSRRALRSRRNFSVLSDATAGSGGLRSRAVRAQTKEDSALPRRGVANTPDFGGAVWRCTRGRRRSASNQGEREASSNPALRVNQKREEPAPRTFSLRPKAESSSLIAERSTLSAVEGVVEGTGHPLVS
jgi:hypothetical protein